MTIPFPTIRDRIRSFLRPDWKIPPEEISDDSPLIRDAQSSKPRPIGKRQLYKLIHGLYHKAGLLRKNENGAYDLRVHSIRKYFKTQMMALGVNSDYIDYMMGHTVDTYHDIQSKGIEFLRNVFATADLAIAPKPKGWELDALKAFARGLGLDAHCIYEHSLQYTGLPSVGLKGTSVTQDVRLEN